MNSFMRLLDLFLDVEQARPEILSNDSVVRESLFDSMAAMEFGTDFKPAELDYS